MSGTHNNSKAVPTQGAGSSLCFMALISLNLWDFMLSLKLIHIFLYKDELWRQPVTSEGQCGQLFTSSLYPEGLIHFNSAPLENDACCSPSVSLASLQLSL